MLSWGEVDAVPGELGGALLGLESLAVDLDVQPPEVPHELQLQKVLTLIPVGKLQYEIGADTRLGQKLELSQRIYKNHRLACKPIKLKP